MSDYDEDDKPTVVLDLNALKKQKIKEDEELANIASELEFAVDADKKVSKPQATSATITTVMNSAQVKAATASKSSAFPVILFDLQSKFFELSRQYFPQGYDYRLCNTLGDLNNVLKNKNFQIVVFNYDQNPKAINQLSAQIKQKFPTTKVMIMAKAISPEKARIHAQTPSGASGYYQLPLVADKIEKEFKKIHDGVKKVG